MGWRDGQGGGAMQPQSSLSGFRGGMNPGAGYGGGALGNSGFVPTTGTGQFPEMSLPPALAGTGGVRSPSGPYGPPGFVGGPTRSGPGGSGGMYAGGPGGTIMNQSLPTGGAEPYNAGSSTTGGPSYAVNPGPAPYGGMGGPAPTPGSGPLLPNDPAWFSSPQGLAQQAAMAQRLTRGMGPGTLGQARHAPVVPGSGPTEGYTSPMDAYRGMRGAERSAAFEAARAGQPRTWYAQELAKAGVNWQGMNDMQQMRAYLNTLPPEQAADYLAKYAALGPNAGSLTIGGWQPGMDPMMSVGPVGSGPFGNGIAS